ncbi:hypothetical protein ABI59_21580 [Acidobacteria bacterium Mor1]|nr:hypothetical protein ABI59_21580 [Acidobacteria bacterium Mor1]
MDWNSALNAEIYDLFVRERSVYEWLNRRLVELAELEQADHILDLACGTGATVLACLRAMPARAEIVGIDASEAMIRVAQANVHDPRASFVRTPASELEGLPGPFQRVVCCAAFWQFPSAGAVFRALASHAPEGSRFVFNVPAERVQGETSTIHPIQAALITEIERESGRSFGGQPTLVDPEHLRTRGSESGFRLLEARRLVYEANQGELFELMSIPAMIGPLTEHLDEIGRDRLLERVRRRIDADQQVEVPWIYFIFER